MVHQILQDNIINLMIHFHLLYIDFISRKFSACRTIVYRHTRLKNFIRFLLNSYPGRHAIQISQGGFVYYVQISPALSLMVPGIETKQTRKKFHIKVHRQTTITECIKFYRLVFAQKGMGPYEHDFTGPYGFYKALHAIMSVYQ